MAQFGERRRPASLVAKLAGVTLMAAGAGMFISTVVEVIDAGPAAEEMAFCGAGVAAVGLVLWHFTSTPSDVRRSQIAVAVVSSWLAFSLVAVLPFLVTGSIAGFDEALFETISGFTTTGATILTDIEALPRGVLFWRSMTQWFGGVGVIVLAVSLLPRLHVGGIELLAAEAPGPTAERLMPQMRATARILFFLYCGLTGVIVIGYLIGGMSAYDAFAHAFTTISTGGYSPYNDSFAHFDSAYLRWFATVMMLVAGGSFVLYYRVIRGNPGPLLRSFEARTYAAINIAAVAAALWWNWGLVGLGTRPVTDVAFSVISISSSTGYTVLDFAVWSGASQLMLLFLMALGGMAGSTTGGFKTMRLVAIISYARRELARQLKPQIVRVVRIGREPVPEDILGRVLGFLVLFIIVGSIASLAVAASGTDTITAISAVATSIGNVGPGLGDVGPSHTFLGVPPLGRGVLMVVMLMGRLEIVPILLALAALGTATRRRLESVVHGAPEPRTKHVRRVVHGSRTRSARRHDTDDAAPARDPFPPR